MPTLFSRRPDEDNGGRVRLGGTSASPGSDKSDETQGILKSMQTMIGTLVQTVSDIENRYE